jgi:hypothetical protein
LVQAAFSRITVNERKTLEEVAGGKAQLLDCLRRFKAENRRYDPEVFNLFKAAVYYDCRDH